MPPLVSSRRMSSSHTPYELFVSAKLGNVIVDARKCACTHTDTKVIHLAQTLQLHTILPRDSRLEISLMERRSSEADCCVGTTTIDLERRWLSRSWREEHAVFCGCVTPIESRSLRDPSGSCFRGAFRI